VLAAPFFGSIGAELFALRRVSDETQGSSRIIANLSEMDIELTRSANRLEIFSLLGRSSKGRNNSANARHGFLCDRPADLQFPLGGT
jgi:hypothetical protein